MAAYPGLLSPAALFPVPALSGCLTGQAPFDGLLTAGPGVCAVGNGEPGWPIVVRGAEFGGAAAPSFADDLYGRIVLLPARIDAGFMGSDTSQDVEIWNTLDAVVTLTGLHTSDPEGMRFDAAVGDLLGARVARSYVLTLYAEQGASLLDGGLTLTFSGGLVLTLAVRASRLAVWPFVPTTSYLDALEWLTEVLTARSGLECRTGLRNGPRLRMELEYNLRNVQERSLFDSLAYTSQDKVCGVPWWPGQRSVDAVSAGAGELVLETGQAGFEAGGLALLRQDAVTWEAVEIEQVEPGRLALLRPVVREYARALVVPLRRCRMELSFQRRDLPTGRSLGRAAFTQLAPEMLDAGVAGERWEELEIFPQQLWCEAGGVQREVSRAAEELDSGTGGVHRVVHSDAAQASIPLILRAAGAGRVAELRCLLHRLAGRQNAFWLPTGREDLVLAEDVAEGSRILRVLAAGCARLAASPARSALALRLSDGSVLYRRVAGAVSSGEGTEDITVSEALPALGARAVRLTWLQAARLHADRVEVAFQRPDQCRVAVRAVEVRA